MKTTRGLIALAAVLALAGCSGDVTAPDPSLRAPTQAESLTVPVEQTTTSATVTPEVASEEPVDDSGSWGSGCCSNR